VHALWLLPLGVAAVGAFVLVLATRRASAEVTATARVVSHVRAGLVPAVASLRRELSRGARRARAGPDTGRR
jgi:cytochrome c-type biogenesis protein CcmH/NrfF